MDTFTVRYAGEVHAGLTEREVIMKLLSFMEYKLDDMTIERVRMNDDDVFILVDEPAS